MPFITENIDYKYMRIDELIAKGMTFNHPIVQRYLAEISELQEAMYAHTI